MRGVVRVQCSYRHLSPRHSRRNPVLHRNWNLLTYSSRYRDVSVVHFGLPAALSMLPLARSRAQSFLTNYSSKLCRVLRCCATCPRGTSVSSGTVPGGLYTLASSSIFPPEARWHLRFICIIDDYRVIECFSTAQKCGQQRLGLTPFSGRDTTAMGMYTQ